MMGFSTKQMRALRRGVPDNQIRKRTSDDREFCYLEGWFAIAEANRIFGFDSWDRETIESRCVMARESRGGFHAVYVAKVRITVRAGDQTIIREGYGTGEGRGTSPGNTHEVALKGAETDGTKRALATFGKPFGLLLYTNGHGAIRSKQQPPPDGASTAGEKLTTVPDAVFGQGRTSRQRPNGFLTALADPSSWREVGQVGPPTRGLAAAESERGLAAADPPPVPVHTQIDKSALPIGTAYRRRDKTHLRFVASRPCLVCGRAPSDPHHIRFAQPRAMGRKVSDEFTVPLCRIHHRELHRSTDEANWWKRYGVDPLPVARRLWERTEALDAV